MNANVLISPRCLPHFVPRLWVLALLAVGVGGCADFSGIQQQAQLQELVTSSAPDRAAVVPVRADWWRDFGDEQLDRLEARALANSPSLKIAQARLARSQAVMEVAKSAMLPQVGAQVDATHQRFTANGMVPPPYGGAVLDTASAQLTASWELDFFGKYRSALDAALGSAKAAEADTQAAHVLLAAQVAQTYFQWVRLDAQTAIAERTLAQRQQTLQLVQDRVKAGLDTRLELRLSEAGLPEVRLQLETLAEQTALTRHALAALLGDSDSSALAAKPTDLSAIRQVSLSGTIPADVLGIRPDIVAARWRVEAAGNDVRNAKTQFYPNINLVGFVGFSSIGLPSLLNGGSQQWGVGPALRLPIFDAGRLRANLRGKTADLDAAIESYHAAVVAAARDVADQVTSTQGVLRQQTEQRAAHAAAEAAHEIALQRYEAGLANYLTVLNAETGVLNQRRVGVDLAARSLETRVLLMHALGGGEASRFVAAR
jgi:NodT family efflux transporter outer membrane factor (OMF) lipoprotein